MSELEEMRVFVQLVEAGSATGAADRLGLATSAISRRMKALEARVGVSLMQRSTRRMHITEEGQLFYERCQRILADIDEALLTVSAGATEPQGILRLTAPLSFGLSHLGPLITEFMQRHPRITMDLDLSDRRVDLIQDGFDVAVRVGQLEDSSLIARRLSRVGHLVCCSPSFLAEHGPFHHPEQLQDLPALCYSNIGKSDRWRYRAKPEAAAAPARSGEVVLEARLQSSNGDVLRCAAAGGLGLICVPGFIVAPAIRSGELVPVLTQYQWFDMELYAVYPNTRHLSGRVRAFADFLVERLGDDLLERQQAELLKTAGAHDSARADPIGDAV